MPEVLHNICNMRSRDLPDMSALALGHCAPLCSCVHIRQITPAHVTYITCTVQTVHVLTLMICSYKDIDNTVYCKSFKVEKFHGFHGSIGKHKTFTVKHFHLVLKMADHSPGSSLKNSCNLLSTLKKVSGIMLPSQNY